MSPYVLCFMLATFAAAQTVPPQSNIEKVNITLFYQTLCPHSIELIQDQLFPTWVKLKDYINVKLIPYGLTTKCKKPDGTWDFRCYHGKEECYGNKIQACALNEFKDDPRHMMGFVRCFMTFSNTYPFKKPCFQDISKDKSSIQRYEECIQGPKGDDVLSAYGDKTPSLKYVPRMKFNGKFYPELEKEAMHNLPQIVCKFINDTNKSIPHFCIRRI